MSKMWNLFRVRPPASDKANVECYKCREHVTIQRKSVRYWPDHLWAGKVSAIYECPKCGETTGQWAHDLPKEWQKDWPRPDWESYCLPRLVESCEFHGIEAIPGTYPTSKWWQQWRKENGFVKVDAPS